MIESNGHTLSLSTDAINPQTNGCKNGGPGADQDGLTLRTKTRLLVRCVIDGWVQDPNRVTSIIKELEQTARHSEDDRARNAAADGIRKWVEMSQRIAEFDDKTDRLDRGDPTENVKQEVVTIEVPRVSRLGDG